MLANSVGSRERRGESQRDWGQCWSGGVYHLGYGRTIGCLCLAAIVVNRNWMDLKGWYPDRWRRQVVSRLQASRFLSCGDALWGSK